MAQGKTKTQRIERERAQRYTARTRMHEAHAARNRRDNVIVSIAGAVVVVAAIAAQFAYFGVGPGSVEPAPATTEEAPLVTPTPLPVE